MKKSASQNEQQSVAIIGAGFVGMAAAWDLVKQGKAVTIFEASDIPGGLASGFTHTGWEWSLEKHYHHIFQTDKDILRWIDEVGVADLCTFSTTKSSLIYSGKRYQLDSPTSLLKFPLLSFFDRIRSGVVLAFLKLFPHGEKLEKYTAQDFLKKSLGAKAWEVIWKPLMYGKFGKKAKKVNMSWFWARIYARSKKLGYFNGGFLNLAQSIAQKLENEGVVINYSSPVKNLSTLQKKFDKVLVTTPSGVFQKIAKDLPQKYVQKLNKLEGLGAMTLILEMDTHFFEDETYWLNINESDWPFLAVVEHTNFVDPKKYGGKTIVYVGKYLETDHPFYEKNAKQLLVEYQEYLEKLSPGFRKNITNMWLFKESFAQPVVGVNHSLDVPSLITPLKNVYWASMQHVYPWDRGVNFAVQIGRKVSGEMK